MVKDHSDTEKGNPLLPHRLLLSINSKGSFIHTTAFGTPVVEHWLEREIAQWVHPIKDRSDDPSHHERTLYLSAMSRSLYLLSYSFIYFQARGLKKDVAKDAYLVFLSTVCNQITYHKSFFQFN